MDMKTTNINTSSHVASKKVRASQDGPVLGSDKSVNGSTKERQHTMFAKLKYTIGTWNVRSMSEGKLPIVRREMDRIGLQLLGISELKWKSLGHFESDGKMVYFSGNKDKKCNGVAFILQRSLANCVLGYNSISDRIITIRIQGKPVNVTFVQVYAPTTDATDEEIETFYSQLQEVLDKAPKKDMIITMGDFNAKVGRQADEKVAGKFGLGQRNEAGDTLVDFCKENQLWIANTHYQQHARRLYTWTSPGGLYRNQIDYIICSQRWKTLVQSWKTFTRC